MEFDKVQQKFSERYEQTSFFLWYSVAPNGIASFTYM